jgi:hypothetical protein
VSFAAAIRALGGAVEPPAQQWGEPDLPQSQLCPRLRTTYSPRASWVEWKGFAEAPKASMPEWARVWDYGPPAAALGLSLGPNSKRPPRYGLQGLTPAGRKQVWRALALLEDDRRLLSFWTVSLPTASLLALAQGDSWMVFQDRVRKELARLLRRAGLPVRLVGVVELQPQRSHAAGFPCPHLHVVFQGRRSPTAHWALSPADLDGVIRAALASAGAPAPDGIDGQAFLKAAGNVQQVRKSVRAYLSKYMTKGGNDTAPHVGGPWEALLPRQWWFWSRPLRDWVLQHVFPIAFPFLCWVHLHRQELQELGLIRLRVLDLPDPRAPMTFEVNWQSPEHCAEVIRIWQDDVWDANWHAGNRVWMWEHGKSQVRQTGMGGAGDVR